MNDLRQSLDAARHHSKNRARNYQSALESKDYNKCLRNQTKFDILQHRKFIQNVEGKKQLKEWSPQRYDFETQVQE